MPDITKCGQCNSVINDGDSDFIACDVCDRWFHAWRECSNLKKTLFKLIRKNDTWVCPSCVASAKQNFGKLDSLKNEIKEVRDLNFVLYEENKSLLSRIKDLELELDSFASRPVTDSSQPALPASTLALPSVHPEGVKTAEPVSGAPHSVFVDPGPHPQPAVPDTCVQRQQLPDLELVGDSHIRDLRNILINEQPWGGSTPRSPVTAAFYPGAPMHHFVGNSVCGATTSSRLPKPSVTVMIGGVNDTTEDSVQKTIDLLESHLPVLKSKQLVCVETPYRYDNVNLNKSIAEQNKKLASFCKKNGFLYIPINFALYRMHYNKKGLHLNYKGKLVLSKLISQSLLSRYGSDLAPPSFLD
jgi:hypothetical protein